MREAVFEPLVSVVIPAYHCADTIAEAVDSALRQDVSLEIIVVSEDADGEIARALEKYRNNESVRLCRVNENLGASGNRNFGVNVARGKYVAFLDADDAWRDGKLKKQLDAMAESGDVLSCTARMLMDRDGVCLNRVIPVKKRITYRDLLKHNSISCSSVLLKREAALEFPMHGEDSHEDYIMWLEILRKYGTATGINEPLLLYRVSNTGKSGSKLQSARKTFRVYRYMGFGIIKSMACFCSYAFNGVKKYCFAKNGGDQTDEA